MEKEKKEIKISLWTFYVLVAAIVVLIGAVVIGALNIQKQQNNKQNGETVGNKITLQIGNYTVNEVQPDEAGVTNEECGVKLINDKEFYIYEGWGSGYSGIYEIKDNKLTCKANLNEWYGGAGPGSKKVDIIFTFDIIRNNKLKLVNIENKNEHNIYTEGLTIDMTYSIK